MEEDTKNIFEIIWDNKEWLFSGIGVLAVGILTKIFFPFNKGKTNEINININNGKQELDEPEKNRLKDLTHILFVDDDTKFKVVSIMKKAGWKNTKSKKDIVNLDDSDATQANIIFVDINGVGRILFDDQGLGLAQALKKKYPKKIIILYSAEPKGNMFHKALQVVDDCLPKNAEPYEFINMVESFAAQLY